ncbi:MAG: acetyl-CoA acetyltransferase, partial [Hyphomicrobiales bacterium]
HISWKSHQNGALNTRAHLRQPVTLDRILNAPMVADPLGMFDCCGVSDGAACAIVTTPEIAHGLGKSKPVTVKALQLAASDGVELGHSSWDGASFPTARAAVSRAYHEAGIADPRSQLDLVELHDCFSITELITLEDLGLADEGRAVHDVLDGAFDRDGRTPCQTDGGLKCFGHPVGASGLRMIYEGYLQLQERAGERQLSDPGLMLAHNMGGRPYQNVVAIAIIGNS